MRFVKRPVGSKPVADDTDYQLLLQLKARGFDSIAHALTQSEVQLFFPFGQFFPWPQEIVAMGGIDPF